MRLKVGTGREQGAEGHTQMGASLRKAFRHRPGFCFLDLTPAAPVTEAGVGLIDYSAQDVDVKSVRSASFVAFTPADSIYEKSCESGNLADVGDDHVRDRRRSGSDWYSS